MLDLRYTSRVRGISVGDVLHYMGWTVVQQCDPPKETRVEVARTARIRQVVVCDAEMIKKGYEDVLIWLNTFGSDLPCVGTMVTWVSGSALDLEVALTGLPYYGEDDMPPIPDYDAE